MSELVLREVDTKVDAVLDRAAALDPRVSKVISDLDLKEVDWKNPMPHALRVSAHIQSEFTELKGTDKMELLKSVLKEVLATSGISGEEQTTALRFLEEILPVAVSAAVMVAKGEFDLKKKIAEGVKAKVAEALADPGEVLEDAKEVVAVATPYFSACWGCVSKVLARPPEGTPTPPLTTNPMHKPSA